MNSNRESTTPQPGATGGHAIARNRQEGAVQAFKMANEAATYLNGNLTETTNNSIAKNKNIAIANKRQQQNNSNNAQSGQNSAGSSGKNKGVSNIAVNGVGSSN